MRKARDKHYWIMYMLKKVAKRQGGMSFKLTKYHGIVHIADDILNLGVPLEVDTGFNESGHKATKTAAKLTQRNENTFDKQVKIHLEEVHLISLALHKIEGKFTSYFEQVGCETEQVGCEAVEFTQKKRKAPLGGAVYKVHFDEEDEKYKLVLTTTSSEEGEAVLKTDLVNFLGGLHNLVKEHISNLYLYSVHKQEGQIFRGHGSYRGNVWRDWALIDWGVEGKLPSKIWGFTDLTALPPRNCLIYGSIYLEPGIYAIIETASFSEDEDELELSEIFVPITKEVGVITDNMVTMLMFFLADVEAIVKPLAVIPDIGRLPIAYFWVKDCESW